MEGFMHILFPGRHHLLTDFQFKYLYKLIKTNLKNVSDVNNNILNFNSGVTSIIFAVTSANHSYTRRNPLPFYLRTMMIQDFCDDFDVPIYVVGIDDVGKIDNFAEYTIKKTKHELNYKFEITPQNTLVLCSTPVLEMYKDRLYDIACRTFG